MNKRVRGAASLSPSRDATHEAQNPASRIWSGAHPGRKRSVRKTCGATKSSGVRMAIVPKKAAVRMSALFLPRAYHASPVFPSSNRAAVAVNSDTPSRMHASRIHGCSMNMRICTNCAATHTQRAANSGNNTSVTLPYPRLSSPNGAVRTAYSRRKTGIVRHARSARRPIQKPARTG